MSSKISVEEHKWRSFIIANTTLTTAPLVPEIKMHLAEESLPIWQKTQDELDDDNLPPPYWAFAWAGGQALARYLLDEPKVVAGRKVLDLGAGSGLTSLAAKKAGAAKVLASDIDQISCVAARLNADANDLAIEATDRDVLSRPPGGHEVLLVGDLFYERPLSDRVLGYLQKAHNNGAKVFVGDPQRTYFPRDRFTQLASYSVPVSKELEDCELKETAVWQLA